MIALADLPTRRNEAWKYSDLRAALSDGLPPVAAEPEGVPPPSDLFKALNPIEIVFEDGHIVWWPEENDRGAARVLSKADPEPPLQEGSTVMGRLAAEHRTSDWMPVIVADKESRPIWLRVIGGEHAVSGHLRIGFVVPEGRTLDLIETYEGPSAGLSNILLEAFVRDGGTLRRTVLQGGGSGVQVCSAQMHLDDQATLKQFVLAEGSKLARLETHVVAGGEATSIELNGVYLAGAGRHADLTSIVEHKAAGGQTRQLIKGAARKGGRGVFQGKIVVAPGAQKTDARQYHHGMLLEEGAEIFAKPELMIHADDVQCAHGNTAGGLDERALFYMRSRGVPEAEARALLIEAFLTEAVPDWTPTEAREEILTRIRTWLGGAA